MADQRRHLTVDVERAGSLQGADLGVGPLVAEVVKVLLTGDGAGLDGSLPAVPISQAEDELRLGFALDGRILEILQIRQFGL